LLPGAGCATKREPEIPTIVTSELAAPTPTFLTGAAAILLTNAPPFSARVLHQEGAAEPIAGELFGNRAQLFFAREPAEPASDSGATGVAYLADYQNGRGLLLSEALQGYAPFTWTAQFTNMVETISSEPALLIGTYRCQKSVVIVYSKDGKTVSFEVWRAPSLDNFPVRLSQHSSAPSTTLTFSKVRLGTPPAELFHPPEAFTAYPSSVAMVNELFARQLKIRLPGMLRGFER